MKTIKLKEIKKLVEFGHAKDITSDSNDYSDLKVIGVSVGVYGRNGLLLEDSKGYLYAITKRASNIFKY